MIGFGERLKIVRQNSGLTQQQLAARLGLKKSSISYYETDLRAPSLDTIVSLSKIFNVSTDYLLGIEKQKALGIGGLTDEQITAINFIINECKKLNNK